MIVGGSVLALIFLIQAIAISLTERSEQNYRLYQIGVSRRSITRSAGLESNLDAVSGTVIALGSVSIVEASLAMAFVRAKIGNAYTPIQIGKFSILTVLLLVIAFVATMLCSHWIMKQRAQTSGM